MVENISPSQNSRARRNFSSAAIALVFALLIALVIRLLLQPDPQGALLWTRAQRLESSNLIRPALRQYALLAQKYPASPYAPLALEREGDILTDLARAGDAPRFVEALASYDVIVKRYSQTPSAPRALLATGDIALNDLKDLKRAQVAFAALLDKDDHREYSSFAPQALIGLGRVAAASRDGKGAQKWFWRVLKEYPKDKLHGGEAQFRLGETYETVWHNKEFAVNAYGATISNFAGTIWAARARENLGLLSYSDRVPRARRVLVQAANLTGSGALQDGPDSATSLLGGLRLVLNARGLNVSDDVVRGWILSGFVAAFDANNPGRVVPLTLDGFENAVQTAGLTYAIDDGGDSRSARQNLQNEIDTGRLVLVYTGQWQLVVGYDSSRDLVFLSSGTRAQTVAVKNFVKSWNRRSPLGDIYTMLSFSTPGDDVREERLRAPQAVTRLLIAPKNDVTTDRVLNLPNPELARRKPLIEGTRVAFSPAGLSAPTWVLTPPKADEKAIHRTAIRRASELMRRERSGDALLNLGALRSLSGELRRLANAQDAPQSATPRDDATPIPTATPEAPARQDATPDATFPTPDETAPNAAPSPIASPAVLSDDNMGLTLRDSATRDSATRDFATAPTPARPPANNSTTSSTRSAVAPNKIASNRATINQTFDNTPRLRAVLAWRNAPAANWLQARRDAATYLNIAAQRLNNPNLRQAASAFQNSISAVEDARAAMNDAASSDSNGQNRALFLKRAADAIERALREETRATEIMAQGI